MNGCNGVLKTVFIFACFGGDTLPPLTSTTVTDGLASDVCILGVTVLST
jgi:hypothetical protein